MSSEGAASRWTVLAGTRFVLATVVLVGHLAAFDRTGHSWLQVGPWLNQGSAVYGFLIISGYSIAASLERSSEGFYARRFWRIFPTYGASLLLAVVAGLFIAAGGVIVGSHAFHRPTVGEFVIALLMLQSFVGPTISTDGQLWTIAVEWWNYMLAPVFRRCSAALLAALIACSLFLYIRLRPPSDPSVMSHGYLFLVLSWLWIAGFLYHRWRRTPLGYAALFIPLTIAMGESWIGRAALLGVFAVALCEEVTVPRFLTAPLAWLGELSYPLYAMHVPVIVVCLILHVYSPLFLLVAVLIVSIATLHVIDLPLRRWGTAVFERRGGLGRSAPAVNS